MTHPVPPSRRACAGPPRSRLAAAALALAWLGACSSGPEQEGFDVAFEEPETQIGYDVALEGAPSEEIAGLMEGSLTLYRRQEQGAQSVAFLRRRARQDIETAQRILRSFGYYQAEVSVAVTEAPEEGAGEQADGPDRPEPAREEEGDPETLARDAEEAEAEEPEPRALATVTIEPGRQFTLASHTLSFAESDAPPPDPLDAEAFGSPVGGPAEAAPITRAEKEAVAELRRKGRPYAEFSGRDAVADLEQATLEVDSTLAAGPPYVFGPVSFSGAPNVDEDYLRSYLPFAEGEVFDIARLGEYQRSLVGTQLFSVATVAPPEEPPEGEAAPVDVQLEEAPFRTFSAGLRYATDSGPGIRLGFEHRNLFGAGERLNLLLDTELDEQEARAAFSKPQFLRDGQFLDAEIGTQRLEESPFDAFVVDASLGVRREIGDRWSAGGGLIGEFAEIDQPLGGTDRALVGGVSGFVAYDSTDDLLDPTRGQRARLTVAPLAGTYAEESTAFVRVETRASAYQDLLGDTRYVLAERVRLGTIAADDLDSVPETQRFYSGGGNSVRGFERYFVGPIGPGNEPTGGLSVAEVSLEGRIKVWNDIGTVLFVDAGTVGQDPGFAFDDDFLVAAGTGLRYYSPIGPVRLDVAFPLNPREIDSIVQVYFSIGQAF